MRTHKRTESGAALVEFALLLPVFMMLVLGMFSGGIVYNQKLDLTHATREAARYGAAVPKSQVFNTANCSQCTTWSGAVRQLGVDRSAGDLTAGSGTTAGVSTDGVCVALVTGSPAAVVTTTPPAGMGYAGSTASYWSTSGSTCFSDSSGDTGDRVQVSARRPGKVEALVFSQSLTLTAKAESKFEGT